LNTVIAITHKAAFQFFDPFKKHQEKIRHFLLILVPDS